MSGDDYDYLGADPYEPDYGFSDDDFPDYEPDYVFDADDFPDYEPEHAFGILGYEPAEHVFGDVSDYTEARIKSSSTSVVSFRYTIFIFVWEFYKIIVHVS